MGCETMMKRGIYLVGGGGYHKIGMTSNLDERLKALRLSVPFEIELFAFGFRLQQKDLRIKEMNLHNRFSDSRVRARSEWFRLSENDCKECVELIRNLNETYVPPKRCSLTPEEIQSRAYAKVEAGKLWASECLERLRPIASDVALF